MKYKHRLKKFKTLSRGYQLTRHAFQNIYIFDLFVQCLKLYLTVNLKHCIALYAALSTGINLLNFKMAKNRRRK